jgi:hypothetical protein
MRFPLPDYPEEYYTDSHPSRPAERIITPSLFSTGLVEAFTSHACRMTGGTLAVVARTITREYAAKYNPASFGMAIRVDT